MAGRRGHRVQPVDPFDLPDWVGVEQVTWRASSSLGRSHLVTGALQADEGEPGAALGCDVLACDPAYPLPVLS